MGLRVRVSVAGSVMILAGIAWVPRVQADSCVDCHRQMGRELGEPVHQWEGSIHQEAGVACSGCHGGNAASFDRPKAPGTNFIGKPSPRQGVQVCARCHADPRAMRQFNLRTDQYSEYLTSAHGRRLMAREDSGVATCVSCHGAHEILSPASPRSRVNRANVPGMCAGCHADPKRMRSPGARTDQMAAYQKGVHGRLLLEAGDRRVPTCADCHGIHGAVPPGVGEVANVCGTCHFVIARYFREGAHARAVRDIGEPKCISCHAAHAGAPASPDLYAGNAPEHCGSCHPAPSEPSRVGVAIRDLIVGAQEGLARVEAEIARLHRQGLDVREIEGLVVEARAAVIEAKPVAHALQVAPVKARTDRAQRLLGRVEERARSLRQELEGRRRALKVALVLTLGIIGLLILKRPSLPAPPRQAGLREPGSGDEGSGLET